MGYKSSLNFKSNKLFFENLELTKVVLEFRTPFYLYSENKLISNFNEFKSAASSLGCDFEVCFALKANANVELLKILADQGSGADIVSGGELQRALDAGIPASKIVFSGVGKTEDEISDALDAQIYSFNVESIQELELINQLAKKKKKIASVAFRLNPKVKALTHKYISTGYKTHKFGLLENEIVEAVNDKNLWTNSKLKGLSIHIGSQLTDLSATQEALEVLSQCIDKLPHELEFVDVGGGLGINYSPTQQPIAPTLDEYMLTIKNHLKIKYPIKIVFEPGRSIVASAGIFIAKVLRTKSSENYNFIIVDGGMNDFARPSLYQAYHNIYPSFQSEDLIPVDIVGPICETADCFGENRMMPKMKAGDFIAISHTGAYGYSMSSNYNLRTRPQELLLKQDNSVHKVNELQSLKTI